MSLVRRHLLITFFALTYALSWILWIPLVFLRDTITTTQGLVLVILSANVPSLLAIVLTAIVFGKGSSTQAASSAPDLARRSPLVSGGSARTCRPRRRHGWLEHLSGRPCPEFGYAPTYRRDPAGLYDLPRQRAGRGDRVARVRPALSASWKKRSERQPPYNSFYGNDRERKGICVWCTELPPNLLDV
jgi:hypothetical protein